MRNVLIVLSGPSGVGKGTIAKKLIESGQYPDLISYGCGVEQSGFIEINTKRVAKGGVVGDKCFATAWCRGNYVLIYNGSFNDIFLDQSRKEQVVFLKTKGTYVIRQHIGNEITDVVKIIVVDKKDYGLTIQDVKYDKKNIAETINFILLKEIGEAIIYPVKVGELV